MPVHPARPTGSGLCIVVPTLDEAAQIVARLHALQPLRAAGACLIVVDGGSRDETAMLAGPQVDRVMTAPRGRASQMNAGAAAGAGDALLFLHADTRLPEDAIVLIAHALADRPWGRFDVLIDGAHPLLRVVERMINLRSRVTGIATGDQAIFARRTAFEAAGGFPELPLMEDVALSRRLKRLGPPACLRQTVTTSGRRWERHGVLRTIVLMWRLRLAYFLGADPKRLAVRYGYRPRED